MIKSLRYAIPFALAVASADSHAWVIGVVAEIPGFVRAAPGVVGGMFQALSPVPAMASGAFTVPAVVNFGGKTAAVSAGMKLAFNAPRLALEAIRLNPTKLVVGAVVPWLFVLGVEYLNGRFVKVDPDSCSSNCTYFVIDGPFGSTEPQITLEKLRQVEQARCVMAYYGCVVTRSGKDFRYFRAATNDVTGTDITRTALAYGSRSPDIVVSVPADEGDFDRVASSPLPDVVSKELINQVPLPVEAPVISPQDVPISGVRVDPVTNRKVQDLVRVTPAPTPVQPLAIQAETYVKDVEVGGVAAPVSAAPAEIVFPTDYARQGEAVSAAELVKTNADKNADKLKTAIEDITKIDDEELPPPVPPENSDFENKFFKSDFDGLLAWRLPGHSGSCPTSDLSFTLFGHRTQLTLDSHCTIFEQVKPVLSVVMVVVWTVVALFIVLGA